MNEVEKKGIGKAKLGLATLTILAVILTASNIWVYVNLQNQIDGLKTDNITLHSQMDTLQTDKSTLEDEVNNLETEKNQLQTWLDSNKTLSEATIAELQLWLSGNITSYESQIRSLNNQIDNLDDEIRALETVDLGGVAELSYLLYSFDFEGEVWNYGTDTASAVSVTLYLYDYWWNEVHSETIYIGTVYGRDVKTFETSFTFYGDWDDWDWYIDWL